MKYPVGIQTFSEIIEGGYIYVDKTAYAYSLIDKGKYYFLSRPRRFGKSLLLSTLEAYFMGKRGLFKGLDIERLATDWEEYPVVHIDLNIQAYLDAESLREVLDNFLFRIADRYDIEVTGESVSLRFSNLINAIYEKTGKKVVILIDEYDKPLNQTIGNPELQDLFREILKGFYGVLKSCDQYIRFGMLTGVSKFGKVSVFSDLNNLNDISMVEEYGALCGITEEELHRYFDGGIEEMALSRGMDKEEIIGMLKDNYDGYHFCERCPDIYNPYSVLTALRNKSIENYWFETGTPTFLLKMLRNNPGDIERLEAPFRYNPRSLLSSGVSSSSFVPMMYQSGYLTIKSYIEATRSVMLGFPNKEVETSFLMDLLPQMTSVSSDGTENFIYEFTDDIINGHPDSMMKRLQAFMADVSYRLISDKMPEKYYQSVIYVITKLVGVYVSAEYETSHGRIDLLFKSERFVYIIELKVDKSADVALNQINDRKYELPFTIDGRTVYKIGANISSGTHTIDSWVISEL